MWELYISLYASLLLTQWNILFKCMCMCIHLHRLVFACINKRYVITNSVDGASFPSNSRRHTAFFVLFVLSRKKHVSPSGNSLFWLLLGDLRVSSYLHVADVTRYVLLRYPRPFLPVLLEPPTDVTVVPHSDPGNLRQSLLTKN